MVMNFLNGGAAINVLARHAGADVICVDVGVKSTIQHERLYIRKVKEGTANLAVGEAMSREEALQAINVGIGMVDELVEQGYQLFATGEMGIGNTTPSSAILSVLTGISPEQAVGRGTGIDDRTLLNKQDVVTRAIAVNRPNSQDPIDVLGKVGGLEIAALVGLILGAASRRCPIIIDGFISSVAALVAAKLAPLSVAYMIPSHLSEEQGHHHVMKQLGLRPMLHMDMRLGEGTGATLCMNLVDAALLIVSEMATFESAGVSQG
jgi:nicotinate-nucleotide--dimethylbenzimidazole phosphoribosyltransferase